ncbi:LytTR family transcriptional regulator DNA-binding domain-containing protein [Tenacibaculum maritimum]|uniref:LytTR family transcriptional regulator DNA-binding domain-containing protein n=1 Tax=Tenacibaculum maritimum TaxID=107401 RepID=UPI003BABC277
MQKKFNFPEFFRVHNSYVINLDFVIEYNKGVNELTMKDGARVSVSRSKKSELMEKLYLDK